MLDDKTLVKVKNRTDRIVGYKIPDLGNLRRQYRPGEIKEVQMIELRKLAYLAGGEYILTNYLKVNNEEAVAELIGEVEQEYFYNEEQIKNILEKGSLAELEDCLDFAPRGVIDLIKEIAISTELNDVRKRQAIFKHTGLNIDKAIIFEQESKKEEKTTTKQRRVAKKEEGAEPAEKEKIRRTTLPKYNVTSEK